MNDRRRVVITGIGPITAFGLGIGPLWNALVERRSAIKRIARFDASRFPCPYGAELPDELFNVRDVVPKSYRKATKVMARDIELAVGAADAAVRDAGLCTKGIDPDQPPTIDPDRFGCHIGAGLIAADVNELTAALVSSVREVEGGERAFDPVEWGSRGMQNLTPLWLLKYLPNMLACHVTIIHDCRGPSNTITCAEASAALSLGESMRVIERSAADACLTGGAEFKLNPMGALRQNVTGRLALATDPDEEPATVVKPFDDEALGTVLGEGGGILVVEAEEIARRREANVYCTVAGFASSQSFCPDTVGVEHESDDESLVAAVENALMDARLEPSEIDAIVPLGAGIPSSDAAEENAIRKVFGSRAEEIPLVMIVPSVGNCCAGASAISLCVGAKMLKEQKMPASAVRLCEAHIAVGATRGSVAQRGDSAAAWDSGESSGRAMKLHHVLVMTTSMGGQNAAVVLSRAT